MTNKEDGDASHDGNPRMAALLAVHLVSQVLDEAYVIANAARDSGQPWRYMSMLKSFKTSRLGGTDDEDTFEASKGDCDLNENTDIVADIVASSTPQKLTPKVSSDEGEVQVPYSDTTFIGQGDEDIELEHHELTKSTSMFINRLFDMSDVEHTEVIQNTSDEPSDILQEAMTKIVETYVANTLLPSDTFSLVPDVKIIEGPEPEISGSGSSDYSFMADAFVADISRDVAFYIDDKNSCQKHDDVERYQPLEAEKTEEQTDENTENMIQKNDVALYENAYATLNRDDELGSDEDGDRFPILRDPKEMTLQEVELMTQETSDDELSRHKIQPAEKPKEAAPTVSGVSGSRKSTLARRCRVQGARLLSCLRGWWRRKTPGKRKVSRCPGARFDMCPLSPDARRRASSLLDHRLLRSPSPSRPVIWKFNTVNETLINSNHWKEYTFDANPENCGE